MSRPLVVTWRNADGSYGAEIQAADGELIAGKGSSMWRALEDAQSKRRAADRERRIARARFVVEVDGVRR